MEYGHNTLIEDIKADMIGALTLQDIHANQGFRLYIPQMFQEAVEDIAIVLNMDETFPFDVYANDSHIIEYRHNKRDRLTTEEVAALLDEWKGFIIDRR